MRSGWSAACSSSAKSTDTAAAIRRDAPPAAGLRPSRAAYQDPPREPARARPHRDPLVGSTIAVGGDGRERRRRQLARHLLEPGGSPAFRGGPSGLDREAAMALLQELPAAADQGSSRGPPTRTGDRPGRSGSRRGRGGDSLKTSRCGRRRERPDVPHHALGWRRPQITDDPVRRDFWPPGMVAIALRRGDVHRRRGAGGGAEPVGVGRAGADGASTDRGEGDGDELGAPVGGGELVGGGQGGAAGR